MTNPLKTPESNLYGLIVSIEDSDWSPQIEGLRKEREEEQTGSLAK